MSYRQPVLVLNQLRRYSPVSRSGLFYQYERKLAAMRTDVSTDNATRRHGRLIELSKYRCSYHELIIRFFS